MHRLLILLVLLAACSSAPPPVTFVNDPTGLLVQNGWTLAGGADVAPFTVPPQGSYDAAAQQLLDASKAAGLDFSALAGRELALQSFPLQEPASTGQPVRGNVLMDGSDVAGAWLSVGEQVYAINVKP